MPQQGMPQQPMQGMPQMPQQPIQGMPQQGMPQQPMQGMPQQGMPQMPMQGMPQMPMQGMPQQPMQGMPQQPMQGMPQQAEKEGPMVFMGEFTFAAIVMSGKGKEYLAGYFLATDPNTGQKQSYKSTGFRSAAIELAKAYHIGNDINNKAWAGYPAKVVGTRSVNQYQNSKNFGKLELMIDTIEFIQAPPMPQQGMPMQGMPQQGMPMQGMPQQGMPMQGMPQQGMPMPGMPMPGTPQQ